MTHPNAERIQAEPRLQRRRLRRHQAVARSWDAVCTSGVGERVGDKLGRDQIIEFLEGVFQGTQADFMIEVHDVLANDRHTVVLAHITAHRDDVTYTADEVHVFNVGEDGLVTEAWGFTGDPEGQGSFGSSTDPSSDPGGPGVTSGGPAL